MRIPAAVAGSPRRSHCHLLCLTVWCLVPDVIQDVLVYTSESKSVGGCE